MWRGRHGRLDTFHCRPNPRKIMQQGLSIYCVLLISSVGYRKIEAFYQLGTAYKNPCRLSGTSHTPASRKAKAPHIRTGSELFLHFEKAKARQLFGISNGFTMILFGILNKMLYNLFSISNRLVFNEPRNIEKRHFRPTRNHS